MSQSIQPSGRRLPIRPLTGCFLPNCAMVIEPACPVCGCTQVVTVKASGTSGIDSENVEVTTPAGAKTKVTKTTTVATVQEDGVVKPVAESAFALDEILPSLGPVPAYFNSDVGTAVVICDNADCISPYQVFVNVTLSAVSFKTGIPPPNQTRAD